MNNNETDILYDIQYQHSQLDSTKESLLQSSINKIQNARINTKKRVITRTTSIDYSRIFPYTLSTTPIRKDMLVLSRMFARPTNRLSMNPTNNSSINANSTTNITTSMLSDSDSYNSTSLIPLSNGNRVLKNAEQISVVNILRNQPNDSSVVANALSSYFRLVANSNVSLDSNYTLTADEIDHLVSNLNSDTLRVFKAHSSIVVQSPQQQNGSFIFGLTFYTHTGLFQRSPIFTLVNDSTLWVAADLSRESLVDVTFVNMLIIESPSAYKYTDNSIQKTPVSPVVVVAVRRNSSAPSPINISLYFKVFDKYKPTVKAKYFCSFYDTKNSIWNNSGCTKPHYNSQCDRYECSCNHLTTFALTWSQDYPPPTISPYNPDKCNSSSLTALIDDTCVPNALAQVLAVDKLRNNSTNATEKAENLVQYFSTITNSSTPLNSTNTLTPKEVDDLVGSLSDINFAVNSTSSFIVSQQQDSTAEVIVLGAVFRRGIGGEIVNSSNIDLVVDPSLLAAGIVSRDSLTGVASLNMFIIGKPNIYRDVDNSTNMTVVSSIIIAAIRRNNSTSHPIDITLYFKILPEYKPDSHDGEYLCAFYDTKASQWNQSGCSEPQHNPTYDRYECICNHNTTFALIWLPNIPLTSYLDAQDIASLIFLSISILCFIAVIIHSFIIRLLNPLMSIRPRDLLPLISTASTTILFIFFIALSMTVYTRTPSPNPYRCFRSASVLMFITYFCLIFMFCVKTSVGYFNYLRFVHLFPEPSHRKLFFMLIISFVISITCVSFAAGFNSNPSYSITQLHSNKLCWFTRDVFYYFMTIPIGIFLLLNFIMIVFIAKHIINHVQNAASPYQSYERIKRCVFVLISSCMTQGVGWFLGPFLSFVDPTAANILGWFFIILNGFEGVWTILLYIIIRSQYIEEQKAIRARKKVTVPVPLSVMKSQ